MTIIDIVILRSFYSSFSFLIKFHQTKIQELWYKKKYKEKQFKKVSTEKNVFYQTNNIS